MTLVAPLKEPGANGAGCLVCELSTAQRQAVNVAIWDGEQHRTASYRRNGQNAYRAQTGETIDPKTITRHVEHIEATWREGPARPGEAPLFPTDYKSIHDQAALLSAQAMALLSEKIEAGDIENRELVNLAKMGVTARSNQERAAAASKRPQLEIRAIFAIGSGHARDFPESEIIDVTPESDLRAEVQAERALLERLQAGEVVEAPNAFDDLFS